MSIEHDVWKVPVSCYYMEKEVFRGTFFVKHANADWLQALISEICPQPSTHDTKVSLLWKFPPPITFIPSLWNFQILKVWWRVFYVRVNYSQSFILFSLLRNVMTNDEVIDFVNIRLKGNEEEENILSKICEEVAFCFLSAFINLKI